MFLFFYGFFFFRRLISSFYAQIFECLTVSSSRHLYFIWSELQDCISHVQHRGVLHSIPVSDLFVGPLFWCFFSFFLLPSLSFVSFSSLLVIYFLFSKEFFYNCLYFLTYLNRTLALLLPDTSDVVFPLQT